MLGWPAFAALPALSPTPAQPAYADRPQTWKDLLPMSHKHEQLIRAIFHDPVSRNIHWRDVESLLHHLGAAMEPLPGARIRVLLNRAEGILHRPHHGSTLDRNAIQYLRQYLTRARVTPSRYESGQQE